MPENVGLPYGKQATFLNPTYAYACLKIKNSVIVSTQHFAQ
ncbi:hypothetical protein [Fortiea sp. LEGE XX443]|nr:hypothetical protein [Fortiea sp. LEGE XX443]